jgi:uncharacterized repeat protein (TIGR03847 family)
LVAFKLEKAQVLFLAGALAEVLADLASPTAVPPEDDLELEEPVEAQWVVGSLQLAYDPTTDRVVLVAREVGATEGEGEPSGAGEVSGPLETEGAGLAREPVGATARVALTRDQAAAIIEHGKRLLRSGRPPCPLCGYPLGEEHSCPKTNGHRPPAL